MSRLHSSSADGTGNPTLKSRLAASCLPVRSRRRSSPRQLVGPSAMKRPRCPRVPIWQACGHSSAPAASTRHRPSPWAAAPSSKSRADRRSMSRAGSPSCPSPQPQPEKILENSCLKVLCLSRAGSGHAVRKAAGQPSRREWQSGLFESRIARIARRQKAAIRAESRGAQ